MPNFDELSKDYVFGEVSKHFTHYLVFPATSTHKSFVKQITLDRHSKPSNFTKSGVIVKQGQPPSNSRWRPELLD
jgi:hypothetical protein